MTQTEEKNHSREAKEEIRKEREVLENSMWPPTLASLLGLSLCLGLCLGLGSIQLLVVGSPGGLVVGVRLSLALRGGRCCSEGRSLLVGVLGSPGVAGRCTRSSEHGARLGAAEHLPPLERSTARGKTERDCSMATLTLIQYLV